ncbi:MAG TPA: CBS domain-containing protein [Armatimonadota bacterium]|nr:CBS domain-containing protein [Armatimonadota bacterium]
MTAKDFMRSPAITIDREATLREAIALLSSHRISGLPVVDDQGDLVGIVTEHDIIKGMLPTYEDIISADASFLDPGLMQSRIYQVRDNAVSSIMTTNVVALEEDASLLKAASTVILKKVRWLPVVRNGKPVGIVSRIDIMQALMQGGS